MVNDITGQDTELILVARAQQGDRQAYGELVSRYHRAVVSVVYRMCGEQQLAEEAAQEAFLRAWQNIQRYLERYSFRSWVYRIALNAALDMLRRERELVDIETLPLASDQDDPERAYERRERATHIQQAVLALPENCRAALILREYESLSYQEIADVLDIPLGTVMSRLNYARRQLKQALAQELENQ